MDESAADAACGGDWMSHMDSADYLSFEEAADYLHVSRQQLQRLCRAGAVPAESVGDSWQFHRAALETFVVEGGAPRQVRVAATAPAMPPTEDELAAARDQRGAIIDSLRSGDSVVQAALKVSVSPRTLTHLCVDDDELREAVGAARRA
jgi:excisionase family DNA binding protein